MTLSSDTIKFIVTSAVLLDVSISGYGTTNKTCQYRSRWIRYQNRLISDERVWFFNWKGRRFQHMIHFMFLAKRKQYTYFNFTYFI